MGLQRVRHVSESVPISQLIPHPACSPGSHTFVLGAHGQQGLWELLLKASDWAAEPDCIP